LVCLPQPGIPPAPFAVIVTIVVDYRQISYSSSDKPDAELKKGLQANAHSPSISAPVLSAYLGLGKFN